jgi:hypothetical protein
VFLCTFSVSQLELVILNFKGIRHKHNRNCVTFGQQPSRMTAAISGFSLGYPKTAKLPKKPLVKTQESKRSSGGGGAEFREQF